MQITKRRILSSMPATLGTSAIISAALVLPFVFLEVANRRGFNEGFPFVLFAVMWLLPTMFILVLTPIVHGLRAEQRTVAYSRSLLARVAFLILITWFWVSLVLDQVPCFLGVPNCD